MFKEVANLIKYAFNQIGSAIKYLYNLLKGMFVSDSDNYLSVGKKIVKKKRKKTSDDSDDIAKTTKTGNHIKTKYGYTQRTSGDKNNCCYFILR